MPIRPAQAADAERIGELLYQVHAVHAAARPDLYRAGARKYLWERDHQHGWVPDLYRAGARKYWPMPRARNSALSRPLPRRRTQILR